MRLKKSSFWSKIPNWVWVLISLAVAIAIWLFAAYTEARSLKSRRALRI